MALVNPQQCNVIPGTHVVADELNLVGVTFEDPKTNQKFWTIDAIFSPLSWRMMGGIRAKVRDNKGFISFINQRDLELLLDLAKPGDWIPWMDGVYPGLNDEDDGWYGICCDSEDLLDDLHYHELLLREQFTEYGYVPEGQEYTRRVQREEGIHYEEHLIFLWDKDPVTGYGPDGRFETLEGRWTSVEQTRMEWKRVM